MEKPLVVMALETEGQGELEKLGFEVLYCGVGKVNAAYHLTRRLMKGTAPFSYVLNLGSAGSHKFRHGELVAADRFVQRDMDVTGLGFSIGETPFDLRPPIICHPRTFEHLSHGVCGSGDSFLQGACPMKSDMVDMEAYSLAKICLQESIPFACVKYITDGADGDAHIDWKTNLDNAAQAFIELLQPIYGKVQEEL